MKGDGHIGGSLYVTEKGKVPRRRSQKETEDLLLCD